MLLGGEMLPLRFAQGFGSRAQHDRAWLYLSRPPHNMLYVNGHCGVANPLVILTALSYTENEACLTSMLNASTTQGISV